jgi:hypothetical protein
MTQSNKHFLLRPVKKQLYSFCVVGSQVTFIQSVASAKTAAREKNIFAFDRKSCRQSAVYFLLL